MIKSDCTTCSLQALEKTVYDKQIILKVNVHLGCELSGSIFLEAAGGGNTWLFFISKANAGLDISPWKIILNLQFVISVHRTFKMFNNKYGCKWFHC